MGGGGLAWRSMEISGPSSARNSRVWSDSLRADVGVRDLVGIAEIQSSFIAKAVFLEFQSQEAFVVSCGRL